MTYLALEKRKRTDERHSRSSVKAVPQGRPIEAAGNSSVESFGTPESKKKRRKREERAKKDIRREYQRQTASRGLASTRLEHLSSWFLLSSHPRGMSRGSFNSLLSSFPRRIASNVKRSWQAEYKSGGREGGGRRYKRYKERKREREKWKTGPRPILFLGKTYSPVTRSDVIPAARHNMKTLSVLSRKAYSNVLSLAAAPALATRSLVALPRQDVRISGGYLCPPDSHGPKAIPGKARRKGRAGADLRKERG